MNNHYKLYDENYDDLLEMLLSLVDSSLNGGFSISQINEIVGYLVDKYTEFFLVELDYLMNELDIDMTPVERRNTENRVDTSSFARANRDRIANLLINRVQEFIDWTESADSEKMTEQEIRDHGLNVMLVIATSELHMAIEKASVTSSKLIQDVSMVKINKTWNSVNDEKTCELCKAMDGITIPVTESFINTPQGADYYSELSYTGGDIPYAHPRCRCWFTYSKETYSL